MIYYDDDDDKKVSQSILAKVNHYKEIGLMSKYDYKLN